MLKGSGNKRWKIGSISYGNEITEKCLSSALLGKKILIVRLFHPRPRGRSNKCATQSHGKMTSIHITALLGRHARSAPNGLQLADFPVATGRRENRLPSASFCPRMYYSIFKQDMNEASTENGGLSSYDRYSCPRDSTVWASAIEHLPRHPSNRPRWDS